MVDPHVFSKSPAHSNLHKERIQVTTVKFFATLLLAAFITTLSLPLFAAQWRGNVAMEGRLFPNDALYPQQEDFFPAISMEVEYSRRIGHSDNTLTITPFARIDDFDQARTHADFREFKLHLTKNDWEWQLGLIKVFWGVTETQHLVDIINQTDQVENIDGEDKLGQPAIHATWYQDWGTMEFFVLPAFRERTFPGVHGRLRGALAVDTDHPVYESEDKDEHIDFAARASGTLLDDWDVGLSLFSGTNRDPQLRLDTSQSQPRLIPYYNQIDQIGIDVQATLDNWLWKLETIHRDESTDSYSAAVGGFEYSFYGIAETQTDLGLLMEYHNDSRGNDASSPFQNDLFIGGRWTMNDAQSTEVLAGAFFDLDKDTRSFRLESSRRLGQKWKLTGEMQIFESVDPEDLQHPLRNDDFAVIELARYF